MIRSLRITYLVLAFSGALLALHGAGAQEAAPIRISTNFPGASLGRVEKLSDTEFRCHVEGQHDERGRNRQASWYYFRLDEVRDRALTLTLTDFIGEYNDRPGAVPMSADTIPVWSVDGRQWKHFDAMDWDAEKKEATLRIRPQSDVLWVAHQPPYTPDDLGRLLADVDRHPSARVEVIGRTVQGRDLHLVTVTDLAIPDLQKKVVWLQARQHAWESGTSRVLDAALRFITSDAERPRELRRKVVFKFQPMGDPDGSHNGKVRFNANGFDVNRHWDKIDLRDKKLLARMPEIWYVKKAIFAQQAAQPIDLLVNMHNTETGEYIDSLAADPVSRGVVERFYQGLVERTSFDPSKPPTFAGGRGSTNSVYIERKVPAVLMEQRIGTSKKLGRRPTPDDRLRFGEQIITEMAAAVLNP
jgi:hypothetical protein